MLSKAGYFARETLISLRRNLLMTLAGILTVTVSLALFGGILVLSRFVDHGTAKIKGGVTLEIFMTVKATPQQVADVRKQLERLKPRQVKSFTYLNHDAALKEFKRLYRNNSDLTSSVQAKDLPESFRVAPAKAELTPVVQRQFVSSPGVKSVATPADALKGLLTATKTTRVIFFVLSGVLLLSSLFLIVNTIRLATYARRREIEVMKLVGASNWFVRVPFILEGLVQGLLGAGFAAGLVLLLKLGFDRWFNKPNGIFGGFFVTTGDAVQIAFVVLLLGVIIGGAGSGIGLRRFLRT